MGYSGFLIYRGPGLSGFFCYLYLRWIHKSFADLSQLEICTNVYLHGFPGPL